MGLNIYISTARAKELLLSAVDKLRNGVDKHNKLTPDETVVLLGEVDRAQSLGFWKTVGLGSFTTVLLGGALWCNQARNQNENIDRLTNRLELNRIVNTSDINGDGGTDRSELKTAIKLYLERFPKEQREARLREAIEGLKQSGLTEIAQELEDTRTTYTSTK